MRRPWWWRRRRPVPVCVGGVLEWGVVTRAHAYYYPAAMCPVSREKVRRHQSLWGPAR